MLNFIYNIDLRTKIIIDLTWDPDHINHQMPLSWICNDRSAPFFHVINLFSPKYKWIALAEMPHTDNWYDTVEKIYSEKDVRSVIIRGCYEPVADFLESKGYEKVAIGREAVLKLSFDHFKKKSLKELVRRGMRHGSIVELERTSANFMKLEDFKNSNAHSPAPQLKYLFFDEFIKGTRLFVFISHTGIWYGAILISENSTTKLHTELIMRRKHAPVGIMEALICHIFNYFKTTKYQELSLGEVPFVVKTFKSSESYKSFLTNKVGTVLRFAYNYKGLFDFKNKFNPFWEDIYLCAKPKIKLFHIATIALKTKLISLVLYKLFHPKHK